MFILFFIYLCLVIKLLDMVLSLDSILSTLHVLFLLLSAISIIQ